MDSVITEFCNITSVSPSKAESYLQLTDNNLEQALQLFFEGIEIDDTPSAPQPNTNTQNSSGGTSGANAIPIDEDDDDDLRQVLESTLPPDQRETRAGGNGGLTRTHPAAHIEDEDEAMARRLQEEYYADIPGGFDEVNGVRAPIAGTTETLVGPEDDYLQPPVRPRRVRPSAPAGIFNPRTPAVWPEGTGTSSRRQLAEITGGASEASTKSQTLAEMYRPPFEIITHLAFEEARSEAREDKKWLLVNVQDSSIFDCQVLNRDIWKAPEVKSTIKENFIFLQYDRAGPDGQTYVRLYFPHAVDVPPTSSLNPFPIIAIVDPRTGEQVKVWNETPKKSMEFVMQLHEFLERYSLNDHAKNPVQRVTKPKLEISHMSEEEMLDLAMRRSLVNGKEDSISDPDELTRAVAAGGTSGNGKAKQTREEDLMDFEDDEMDVDPPAPAEQSPFQKISKNNSHSEPAANAPNTTRIQLRLSDGSRVVRRFALGDKVSRIYEYIKADLLPELATKRGEETTDKTRDKVFECVSLGKNLIEVLDSTIEAAGLKMGTIMIEFVESD